MTEPEMLEIIRKEVEGKPYGYKSQLARQMEVTPSYVGQWLAGKYPIVSDAARSLLDALGLEISITERE